MANIGLLERLLKPTNLCAPSAAKAASEASPARWLFGRFRWRSNLMAAQRRVKQVP